MDDAPWQPGDTILLEEVWRRRTWAARPMTFVDATDDRYVVWMPAGTVWKCPTTPPHRPKADTRAERTVSCLALGDWELNDRDWDASTLWLVEREAHHMVGVSWHPDGQPWGWYINLQEPVAVTERGLQTFDLALDILIGRDGTWRWKDEDELDALIQAKLVSPGLAKTVREEGRRVIASMERGQPPFSEPWHDWKPDSGWAAPSIPAGWSPTQ